MAGIQRGGGVAVAERDGGFFQGAVDVQAYPGERVGLPVQLPAEIGLAQVGEAGVIEALLQGAGEYLAGDALRRLPEAQAEGRAVAVRVAVEVGAVDERVVAAAIGRVLHEGLVARVQRIADAQAERCQVVTAVVVVDACAGGRRGTGEVVAVEGGAAAQAPPALPVRHAEVCLVTAVTGRFALLVRAGGAGYIAILVVAAVAQAAEQARPLVQREAAIGAEPVVVDVLRTVVLVAVEITADIQVQSVTLPVRAQQQRRRQRMDAVLDFAAAPGIDVVVARGPEDQLWKGAERAPGQPGKLTGLALQRWLGCRGGRCVRRLLRRRRHEVRGRCKRHRADDQNPTHRALPPE